MQENNKPEKPKILGPKPTIASKPKYIPPVKRNVYEENTTLSSSSRGIEHKTVHKESIRPTQQKEKVVEQRREIYTKSREFSSSEVFQSSKQLVATNIKYDDYSSSYISEKCDKLSSYDMYKKVEEFSQKAPNSPSTVCCSILSNTTNECCGIITNVNKKELNGKTITKVDSVDSNSSDSGGFKDFVQLDLTLKTELEKHESQTHQRKASQPDFLPDKKLSEPKFHQRNSSQPDFISQEMRQSVAQSKQNFIANAQALAQYLPQTEQKILQHNSERLGDFGQQLSRFNAPHKTEEVRSKPKPIIAHSQFQQSTKKLEELLSQRIERDKIRKGQSCLLDGESSQDVEQKMKVQRQIHQKLQADLQQTVKQIQEIQSIELRLPQNRKWTEV